MTLKLALLIFAVSADGLAAAAGMGSAGIKIPFRSAAVISLTGTVFLGISVTFADFTGRFIPAVLCRVISASMLVFLGTVNLFYGDLKRAAEKKGHTSGQVELFFDGTAADRDNSKTISCREALALSVALSADSLVTGISAGLGEISVIPLVTAAFCFGLFSVMAGAFIGEHIISTKKIDLQKVCGVILIALAFFR